MFIRLLIAVTVTSVIISTIILLAPGKTIIPKNIKNQVTSTILLPKGSEYSLDKESAKYNKADELLTFKIRKNNQTIAIVTEQPTPDTVTDIPEFTGNFFTQAGEYKTFESLNGTVHLLHPQKGIRDAAEMNSKRTLIFENPQIDFSEDDWHYLFKSITV